MRLWNLVHVHPPPRARLFAEAAVDGCSWLNFSILYVACVYKCLTVLPPILRGIVRGETHLQCLFLDRIGNLYSQDVSMMRVVHLLIQLLSVNCCLGHLCLADIAQLVRRHSFIVVNSYPALREVYTQGGENEIPSFSVDSFQVEEEEDLFERTTLCFRYEGAQ